MPHLIFSFFFLISGFTIYAQENKANSTIPRNYPYPVTSSPKATGTFITPSKRYLGKEKTIKKIMIDGSIPKSFPAFNEKKMTKESYEIAVTEWLLSNKGLIKPEYHQKIKEKQKIFIK